MDPGSYSNKMRDPFENKRRDNPLENLAYHQSIENANVAAILHFQWVSPGGKAAGPWQSVSLLPAEVNLR